MSDVHTELKNLEQATYTDLDSKRAVIDSFLATKIEELEIKMGKSTILLSKNPTEEMKSARPFKGLIV